MHDFTEFWSVMSDMQVLRRTGEHNRHYMKNGGYAPQTATCIQ